MTYKLQLLTFILFSNLSHVFSNPVKLGAGTLPPDVLCELYLRQVEKDINGDPYKGEIVLPYAPEEEIVRMKIFLGAYVTKLPYNDLSNNPDYVNQVLNSGLIDYIRVRAEKLASTVTWDKKIIINAGKTESNNFITALSNNPRRKGFDLNGYFGPNFETRVKENTMNGRYHY